MEHEDNGQFNNFLQNIQHNLQHGNNNTIGANEGLGLDAGIGCGGVGTGTGDIVLGSVGGSGTISGGKYEELDENRHFTDDDNEWKYITEIHQSEKKTASNGNKNLHADYNNDEIDDNDKDDYDNDDADMPSIQYRKNNNITPNGNGEHLNGGHSANNNNHHHHHELDEFDINKADIGDFSTASNTVSTAEGGAVQFDLLIGETNFENQQGIHNQQQQQQHQHDLEEEDPSSNCTSSLSENLPQQQQQQPLSLHVEPGNNNFGILDGGKCDDKENANPFSIGVEEHATELNFGDSHFLLNPDAKEFVPSFSSNPTSPTISEADHPVGEPVEPAQEQYQQQQQQQQQPQQQQLSALSRHLLLAGDDDFVARSPRKGREMDLDGLALPPSENEFEHEAAMRPHELEQEEDLIGDSSIVATGANDFTLDVASTTNTATEEQIKQFNDGADFVLHGGEKHEDLQSPVSFIDHDVDIHMKVENSTPEHNNINDVMKQSIYEENNTAVGLDEEPDQIEIILNSVQPLPTDIESLNNSFIEDDDDDDRVATPEEVRCEKELLHDHDEKDHVSHPPSIEEMQLNLENDFNASNKDIAQIPSDLDMNSASHMQESFYMQKNVIEQEQQHLNQDAGSFEIPTSGCNESILSETSIPFDGNTSLLSTTTTTTTHELIPDANTQEAFDYNIAPIAVSNQLLINTDFTTDNKDMDYDEQQQHAIDLSSLSPHSTVEEKHLVEETKEQLVDKVIDATQEFVDELEQKVDNLLSSSYNDGDLKQVSILFKFFAVFNIFVFVFFSISITVLIWYTLVLSGSKVEEYVHNCFQVFLFLHFRQFFRSILVFLLIVQHKFFLTSTYLRVENKQL